MADTGFGLAVGGGSRKLAVRRILTPEESPFADAAALEAWALADAAKDEADRELRDSLGDDAQVTVVVVLDNTNFSDTTGNTYQWNGDDLPTSYDIEDWLIYKGIGAQSVKDLLESNPDTNAVTDAEKAAANSLAAVDDGKIPFVVSGVAGNSPYRVVDGEPRVEGTILLEGGSAKVGDLLYISENSTFLGLFNDLTGDSYRVPDFRTPSNGASRRIRRMANIEPASLFPIFTDDTNEIVSPIELDYLTTLLAAISAFQIKVSEDITNLRIRVSNVSPEPSGQSIKHWPSLVDWIDGTGEDLPVGTHLLDFDKSPLLFLPGRTVKIEAVYDSGKILGDATGNPHFSVLLQRGRFVESQDALENVNVVLDSTDYQSSVNQSLSLELKTNNTVFFPDDGVDGDVLRIKETVFNGGTEYTVKNADDSFVFFRNAVGDEISDTAFLIDDSLDRKFELKGGNWWLHQR